MTLVRLLLATLLAFAPLTAARAQEFPQFTGLVVDAANVLPPAREAALTSQLEQLQQQTNHQLVVATVPDLQGYPIEDYGYRLLRSWGVGLKDADNGAILIVAPEERKVRVEVGYGLEPVLTDAFSSTVVNGTILPRFKEGDMPGGIVAGVDALAQQLSLPEADAQARAKAAAEAYDRSQRSTAKGGGGVPFGLVFWGMVLLFVLLSLMRGRGAGANAGGGKWRQRRYRSRRGGGGGSDWPIVLWTIANAIERSSRDHDDWGGGGGGWGGGSGGGGGWGGGGFTGGGGGSGGGGGASGSW